MCDVKLLYKSDFLLMAEYEMHCVKIHCLRCTKLTQYKEWPRLQARFWKERGYPSAPEKKYAGAVYSYCICMFKLLCVPESVDKGYGLPRWKHPGESLASSERTPS